MEPLFSWSFESRLERGKRWYTIASALAITSIIVSFLVGNYLLGIVIILFIGVYLLYDTNIHPAVTVEVTSDGIIVNSDLYAFARIRSFSIIQIENKPLLLRLRLMNKSIGMLDLFFDPSLDVSSLRTYLASVVEEEPESELTVIEHILMNLRL